VRYAVHRRECCSASGVSWRLDEPGQCLRPPLAERLSVQREVILALAHLSSVFADGRPRASGVDLVRRGADRFGLDDADGVLVDVEQVVRPTVALCHDDLTDRDPRAGDEVQALPVLHHPAGIVELPVNQDAGAFARPRAGSPRSRQRTPEAAERQRRRGRASRAGDARGGAVQEWLQFFLVSVRRQFEDAVSRAGQLVQRREKYYEDCRLDRSRVSALVPLIFANPFLTASECSE